jgi:molybdenum cofactor cytidylyltransferase
MSVAAIVIATARAAWSDETLALLPWNDHQTLVEFQVAQLQLAHVRDIEVVLGHDAERIIPLVAADNVEPIVNERWADDPASSLRVGAAAVVRGTTAAVVIDVAEPRDAAVIEMLLDAHRMHGVEVTVPAVAGQRQTPVVLGERALTALRNVHGAQNLWSIVDRFAEVGGGVHEGTLNGFFPHIDSRESYERAREALRER